MTITYAPGQSPDDARRALEAMVARLKNLQPVLAPGAEMLLQVLTLGFERGTSPDGTPWAPNAASTVARKGSSAPNVDTTRLKRSVTVTARGNTITLGSNAPYAGPVHYGSTRSGMTIDPAIARRKRKPLSGTRKPRKNAAQFVSTPWKTTVAARPILPYDPAGNLMSSGPIAAVLERLNKSIVDYIATGQVR